MIATRPNGALPAVAAALLTLCGCASETDKAAAPLPSAFEALGLRGLTYAKATSRGDTVTLVDARAEADGRGEVRASEISIKGFKGDGSSWDAERVSAERVTGAVTADRTILMAPSAKKDSGRWKLAQSGAYADGGIRGWMLGSRAEARHVGLANSSNPVLPGVSYEADGLRLENLGPANDAWNVRATVRSDVPGKLVISLNKAESPSGSVTGTLVLEAPADAVAGLSALDASALSNPARWPDGFALRSLEADISLPSRPSWLPGPEGAADPYVASILSVAAEAFVAPTPGGASGFGLRLAMSPPVPVPVRDVPRLLAAKDASTVLGIKASGPGLPRAPEPTAPPPPFTMGGDASRDQVPLPSTR